MAKKRKKIPDFFSFEIGEVRGIAASMKDDKVWGQWSRKALDDLSIGCILDDTDPRVRKMYEESKAIMEENYNRKKEWYENKKASRNQLTADGDTREDSLNITDGRNAAMLESGTSANLYGDASHREAEDESATVSGKNYAEEGANGNAALNMTHGRNAVALESGTSSANLRGSARPQKTGAGASIAPLLISPLENRAPSPTIANRSDKKQPVNIGAAAPAPHLGPLDCHNREPQAPSPGASHISGDVLNLAYAGEFGNVRLTQEQYSELGIKFGNMQKLNRAIDSLSCQIENGEKNPQNHYAELVKWASYRDDMEEKEELRASSAPHYETVSEHNARIVRESDAWIHEYCQQQKKNRKAANG